ncbi:MAG: cellulase family glycosylhydrolase [Opitutae bacterium]|nr:cellulase family glycosylhydrolase [Opitutae bacterium]
MENGTSCSSDLPWGHSLNVLKSGFLALVMAGGMLPVSSALSAKERSDATIRLHIDVAEPTGPIGKHLSGQHDWRLEWLDALDSPIARRCCGHMWSEGAWPAEGEYNWTNLDEKVEAYLVGGRKLILAFSYVPRWLWSDPDDPALNERTIPGQFEFFDHIRIGNALPPANYEKWEELIYQTVKHLNVDKQYGVIFEAWNEPNAAWFWRGTMEESLRLYEHTARAVKRADPNTMIGGPTLAGGPTQRKHSPSGQASGYEWMETFIKYCAENEVPVDFISWHYYEYYARKYDRAVSFTDQIQSVRDLIRKYPAIGNPKLVIDEWGYDWNDSRDEEIKALIDSPYNSAWAAQSLFEMVTSGVDMAAYCASVGDSPDAPNPTFAVFEMFNRLGSVRLKTSIENRNSKIGALASGEESKISILVWDFEENTEAADSSPKSVQLNLDNLPAGDYQQARYLARISHKFSTADFAGFANLQGVDPASSAPLPEADTSTRSSFARNEFYEKSGLANDTWKETSLLIAESKLLQSDGRAQLEFELETNAVTLVELTPAAKANQ